MFRIYGQQNKKELQKQNKKVCAGFYRLLIILNSWIASESIHRALEMASLLFHDEPKLYAEKDYWSQQHMIWKKMLVKKPRLPTSKELTPDKSTPRWRDDKALWPPAFLLFSGKHNEGTIQALVKICEEFEDDKRSPPSLVIYGAKGSGKTAMAHILIQEFCTELEVSDSQKQKWILMIDAAQHTENFSAMWDMVKKFIEPPQDRFLRNVGFRIVVVDNADILPVSAQQTLRKLMDTFLPVAHFVFVCADINKITQYVKDLSVKLRSRAMGEQDSLAWIVKFLFRRNIGFNREGIQLLFKICKDRSLTDMLNVLQDVFVQVYSSLSSFSNKVLRQFLFPLILFHRLTCLFPSVIDTATFHQFGEYRYRV